MSSEGFNIFEKGVLEKIFGCKRGEVIEEVGKMTQKEALKLVLFLDAACMDIQGITEHCTS
jgi:hypothetical protein